MPKSYTIRTRVKPRPKRDAAVRKKTGLSDETKQAIRDAKSRKGLETFESFAAWTKKMRTL